MSKELKSCPFCGGKARRYVSVTNLIHVYCPSSNSCGVHPDTGFFKKQKDADEAWNRRADDGAVNMPDVSMMIEDASAPSVVDVVRCNNCKWFSNDTECKNCADIDESCGYCRYFCACVRDDGYCYHGEGK